MLLVSGSGQNTGKTSLVCRLIKKFSSQIKVVGIKITHHFHPLAYEMPCIVENEYFKIFEETRKDQLKDSSRMLRAGSTRVFFVISDKHHLGKAMSELLVLLDQDIGLICESGGLADFYQPGLHLHLTGPGNRNSKDNMTGFDLEIYYDGIEFNTGTENIVFEENNWILKN